MTKETDEETTATPLVSKDGEARDRGDEGGVRLVLVLMVRNEASILARCLASVHEHVDAVLLNDTGSTDDTTLLFQAFPAACVKSLVQTEWRDFGHNRTLSLEASRILVHRLGWDMAKTFALVLDADMQLVGGDRLRAAVGSLADADGFTLTQRSGSLEYLNTRIMRLSRPWRCVGVTHEYWDGGSSLYLDCAWINDVGDGGCKHDKFERDERLLLRGIDDEPDNVRYMFYLAQTYMCMGQIDKSVEWYDRRIAAGGWAEEVWYSHFTVGRMELSRGREAQAEMRLQQAAALLPARAEAPMMLATHFRKKGQHHKAWHYLRQAEGCRPYHDALFMETEAYGHCQTLERCLLARHVLPDAWAEGVDACLAYQGPCEYEALESLSRYARRLPSCRSKRLHFPAPPAFQSSSVACNAWGLMNVRTVNYNIRADGSYELGSDGTITTRNFACLWDPRDLSWSDWREALVPDVANGGPAPRQDCIRGLEDVRLFGHVFTATTREFSYTDTNRMVFGTFPDMRCCALKPPDGVETACEKNWLPVDEEGLMIYDWHPLRIGLPRHGELSIVRSHATPSWFRHFRGSAPPFRVGQSELWALTHVVAPTSPRRYLHVLVALDSETLRPVACSRPFIFLHRGIEYCVAAQLWRGASDGEAEVQFFVSVWDRESWVCRVPETACRALLRPL